MATEDIIVKIRTEVKELKGLVNLRQDLEKLKRVNSGVNKQMGAVDKKIGKLTKGGKAVTHVMSQFKFELLGVMFFGMGVSKILQGLLKPAFEVAGVFEIMAFTMQDLFMPVATDVAGIMEKINTEMGKLPEPIQRVIGWIVFLAEKIFTGIFWFGMFALGLDSIGRKFPKLIPKLKTFGKGLLKLIAGVGLLSFLKKNWLKIIDKLKPALKLLGARLLKFGGLFVPIVRLILIFLFVLDLLKLGANALKKTYGDDFFDPFIRAINKVLSKWNEMMDMVGLKWFLGIREIPLGESPVGETGPIDIRRLPEERETQGDSFFNVTINTTNGIDEVSLKDELKAFVNESNVNGTASLFHR